MKGLPKFLVLCILIVLMACQGNASEYDFGTKVLPQDRDIGRSIQSFPCTAGIYFWDIGEPGYGADDIVYLHVLSGLAVNINDIRLIPFGGIAAGTRVTPQDNDIGKPLTFLPASIGYMDLDGSSSYDLGDSVYIHYQSNMMGSEPISRMGISSSQPVENLGKRRGCIGPIKSIGSQGDRPAFGGPAIDYGSNKWPKSKIRLQTDHMNIKLPDSEIPHSKKQYDEPTANSSNKQLDIQSESKVFPTKYKNRGKKPTVPKFEEIFEKRISYSGPRTLPPGTSCASYSDGFRWLVSDLLIDEKPYPIGTWQGMEVEVIHGIESDYYHVLGTSFARSIQRVVENGVTYPGDMTNETYDLLKRVIQFSASPAGYTEPLKIALSVPVIYSSPIKGSFRPAPEFVSNNDIRLSAVDKFQAGTRVLNLDIDQGKKIASPVLMSFPKQPSDTASFRFYDANGNGIYDDLDDIYLDISGGSSSISGTVSSNNLRLSGQAG